ncbi:MAG: phosphodiester glycosidase family protein [Oscillospiraceae bacterium]|nr:phosphodiester glycosidase family protein [Oscillospiraceae bacterium]
MTDSTQNAQGSAGAAPSGKRSRQRKTVEDSTDAQASSDAAQAQETPAVVSTARSYEDENVRITLTEQLVNGTTVYVADVQLSSAEYLKTAFANDTYGKNVTATTSAIAAAHNAILAVNGDYYGARERGYVIRNGIVYRDSADDADVLCIYADGTMEVVDPSTVTAQELVARGVWQAFSFGPALVEDGTLSVSQNDEVGRAKASNPRTALGMIDPLHYVFVVSDGRTDESEGLSLYELAELLRSLGVQTAYNLDGGGSSSMVFQGELINNPTTTGNSIKERGVSDIVYIG